MNDFADTTPAESLSYVYLYCALGLVDLVRFELTTSSMPFKKYQSLAGNATRNTRLSVSRRGRQWTPQSCFFGGLTPRGLQDSTPRGTWRALSRARLQANVIVFCWSRHQMILL